MDLLYTSETDFLLKSISFEVVIVCCALLVCLPVCTSCTGCYSAIGFCPFGHWEVLGIISYLPTSKVRVLGQSPALDCTDQALSHPVPKNSTLTGLENSTLSYLGKQN